MPDSWKTYKSGKDDKGKSYIIWVNPARKKDREKLLPSYMKKTLKFDDKGAIYESNVYQSGKEFETIDGSVYISLIFTYYFQDDIDTGKNFKKGWDIRYFNESGTVDGKILSLSQGDSTLSAWGLKRE